MTRILNMTDDELRWAAAKSGPKSPLRDLVAQLDTKRKSKRAKSSVAPRDREHQAQAKLFEWQHKQHPELDNAMFAVPNFFGNMGLATLRLGKRLNAEGRKKGVADIIVLVPRGPFHALCIELKVPPNDVDNEQRAWLGDALSNDYCALVVYVTDTDIRNATAAIESYLALGKHRAWRTDLEVIGKSAPWFAGRQFDDEVRDAVATERRQKRDVAKKVSKNTGRDTPKPKTVSRKRQQRDSNAV